MVPRADAGKIVWLLDIIEKHPIDVARDFREKFQISILDIGLKIRYDETALLVLSLLKDPTSWLHASLAEWDFPVSRDWLLLADLYDLQHASKTKRKPKSYPRPFTSAKRYGGKRKNGKVRSAEEIQNLLRPHHNLPPNEQGE